jgi:hypothetical protein
LISDVLVPVLQAAISGALLAALLVFVVSELVPDWDADLLKVWSITALAITAGAWLLLLGQTRRLLWTVEKLTGHDLDGDRQVGRPQERLVVVNAPKGQQAANQRGNAARASLFADFVARLPTRGTDARSWERELGRETYQEFRDVLLKVGWAKWNSTKKDGTPNERRGWTLVLPAAEILERISG